MSKAVADLFWNQHYSDYVLAMGIGAALPILRAALDALVFKVGMPHVPPVGSTDPPRGIYCCGAVYPASERGRTTHALSSRAA